MYKYIRASNQILSDELYDILHDLIDGGFDVDDIDELKEGLGAYLGFDRVDQKTILQELKQYKNTDLSQLVYNYESSL